MKTTDISLASISALCGYATTSTILYCAQRFSHLLTPPLMRIDSLACRLMVPRYSWQTYPDLAVSRFPSKVCENARFQSVLHIWRPNWWMSLGIEKCNREKQLTCWAMHEDTWCFWNSGAFVSCELLFLCYKGIGLRRRDELRPTEIYTITFQRVFRVQGVAVEDNPTKAADSHQ